MGILGTSERLEIRTCPNAPAIPAKAGIQPIVMSEGTEDWIPAYAGMASFFGSMFSSL